MARPALKAVVEGESSVACLIERQFLQVVKSPSATKKPGIHQSMISSGKSSKVFEGFKSSNSSSDEDVEKEDPAKIEIYEGSSIGL